MAAFEVEVCSVHYVERASFRNQHAQNVDVMQLPVGIGNECGNVALQVELRVRLHGALRLAEPRLWEQRQAGFDVAQDAPVGGLGESHAPVQVRAGECFDVPVPANSRDRAAECVPWWVLHDLGENETAEKQSVLTLDGAQQGGDVT